MTTQKPVYYPSGKVLSEYKDNRQIVHQLEGARTEYYMTPNGRYTGEHDVFDSENNLIHIKRFYKNSDRSGFIKDLNFGNAGSVDLFQLNRDLTKETIKDNRFNVVTILKREKARNAITQSTDLYASGNIYNIRHIHNSLTHGKETHFRDNEINQLCSYGTHENGIPLTQKLYRPDNTISFEYEWQDISTGSYIKTEYMDKYKHVLYYKNRQLKGGDCYKDNILRRQYKTNDKSQKSFVLTYFYPENEADNIPYKEILIPDAWDDADRIASGKSILYKGNMQIENASFAVKDSVRIHHGEVITLNFEKPENSKNETFVMGLLIKQEICSVHFDENLEMLRPRITGVAAPTAVTIHTPRNPN